MGAALAAILAAGSPLAWGSSPAHATETAASADSIVIWDAYAQQAIWDVARQQPQVQARGAAMVHGAMYDAVNAITGTRYEPYLVAPAADGTESIDAAVAASSYRVLVSIFPEQQARLQQQYDGYLATIPDSTSKQRGISVGEQAAAAMVASRQNDGYFGSQKFAVGTQPGEWRPTPPFYANDGAWVGHMKPFLVPDPSTFRTSGPPALTSVQYAKDINEVKAIGAVNSTVRTADQTQAAIWWHDRRQAEWEIKRQLVGTQNLTAIQAARMYAMVNLAEIDAVIACFATKEAYSRWRPVTAIQLADTDGNAATAPDPAWTPLLITPPHPDFTAGHTCATASSMASLAVFFGRDSMSFSAYSVDANATRYFSSFSQAVAEVIEARIWGGVHTRTADLQGAAIGLQSTAYMAKNHFRPRG